MRNQIGFPVCCAIFATCSVAQAADRPREQGELSTVAQSAVVTALTVVEGYGSSEQHVLVQCQEGPADTYRVSISVRTGTFAQGDAATKQATLLAVVETSSRGGATVKYRSKRNPASGNEAACRAAVAYRAQQGSLPSGFWMTCNVEKDVRRIFFWTEPNRWPGDHWHVSVSDSSLRFFGGM